MARATTTTSKTADAALAREISTLRLGESVFVTVAPDVHLVNNESRGRFEPGARTPQTVTPTLLRRLRDGDLTLA